MKGCLIAFVVVLIVLMILVTAAVVVFFGFEKDLPQSLVDSIKDNFDGLADATVTVDYNLVNEFGDVSCVYEDVYYAANGEELSYLKAVMERKGKDETLTLAGSILDKNGKVLTSVYYYIEVGKYLFDNKVDPAYEMEETEWKNKLTYAFTSVMPLEARGDKYGLIGAQYIQDNLSRITQKGMNVTAYAYNDLDEYCMTYNLSTNILSSYKITLQGKESDTYKKRISTYTLGLDLSKFM